MEIRSLLARFGFDVDMKGFEDFNKGIKQLTTSTVVLGGQFVAAIGTLAGFAKFTANAGDEALKTARSLGIETSSLQKLQYASETVGVSSEEMNSVMINLTRSARDAALGSEQLRRSFGGLGVDVMDRTTGTLKKSDVLVKELAESLSKMPDGTRKATLTMDLFGASGTRLLTLFKNGKKGLEDLGREAEIAGFVMSKNTTLASEEFNISLSKVFLTLKGLRNVIGGAILPLANKLLNDFRKLILANSDIIKQNLGGFVKALTRDVKFFWGVLTNVIRVVREITDALGGFGNVLKWIAIGIGAISFGIFLSGIGNMVIGLEKLILGFFTLKSASISAWIAATAGPLAVGAAILLVAMAFEDLWGYLHGSKSLIGDFMNYLETELPTIAKILQNSFGFLGNLAIWIKDAVKWIVKLNASVAANDYLTNKGMAPKELPKFETEAFPSYGGYTINPPTMPGIKNAGNSTKNVSINAPVNITVDGSKSPEITADEISSKFQDHLNDVLYKAQIEGETEGAY